MFTHQQQKTSKTQIQKHVVVFVVCVHVLFLLLMARLQLRSAQDQAQVWSINMASLSELSRELLRLFALGELSSVQVHRLASAAWSDGWGRTCSVGKKLAHLPGKASSEADRLKNCSRNLFLIVERSDLLPRRCSPYVTRLPDGSDLDVYLPHEIYPSVAKHDPSS